MIYLRKINNATPGLQADETIKFETMFFDQKEYQAIAVDVLTR
jgi:hypothetical protein